MFKKFWMIHKYNVCIIIIMSLMQFILAHNHICLHTYTWWIYTLLLILLLSVIYRDGKRASIKKLLSATTDITITDKTQNVYLLKDVKDGEYFSLINQWDEKETLDKYMKISTINEEVRAFNITQRKIKFLTINDAVILYSTKTIYTPKIETDVTKEDTNEL